MVLVVHELGTRLNSARTADTTTNASTEVSRSLADRRAHRCQAVSFGREAGQCTELWQPRMFNIYRVLWGPSPDSHPKHLNSLIEIALELASEESHIMRGQKISRHIRDALALLPIPREMH